MRKLRIMASLTVDINIEEEENENIIASEELEVSSTTTQKWHHNLSTFSIQDQDDFDGDDGEFLEHFSLLYLRKIFYEILLTHQFYMDFFQAPTLAKGKNLWKLTLRNRYAI